MKSVNVLGTEYKIIYKKYEEDKCFKKRSIVGYCNSLSKTIVVGDMHTFNGWEDELEENILVYQKLILRHEIVHAFLSESGLQESSACFNGPWAENEEMVDWIAIQTPKLLKAFEEADCL